VMCGWCGIASQTNFRCYVDGVVYGLWNVVEIPNSICTFCMLVIVISFWILPEYQTKHVGQNKVNKI
jgi:hypothetical protein